MATSRISNNTSLSSSIHERRQVQARIRVLQQRTNALYEELSRSSSITKTAVHDIERAYMRIIDEFREQRDQLLQRLSHVKKNIKQSTTELEGIRKNLNTAQSFRISQNSPRYSNDIEIHEMNAMVDDIERVLNSIAHQLKQVRFIPSHGHTMGKTLGTIRIKDTHKKQTELKSTFDIDDYYPTDNISVHKLYTIDLDISAQWIVSSIDKRIFLCDSEGEIRIYSYSRQLHRQPLLTERFHLSIVRLITSFTVTQDYLIAFESDTQILTLHTHHGALLLRLYFPYDPTMIICCDYQKKKNQIWACSQTKRQCYQFNLNHTIKQVNILDQLDFTKSISNVFIDPYGISSDKQDRIAVHDVNTTTMDRLILFTNQQNTIISLDFIKYLDNSITSRIERVLLVPNQSHLIIIVYSSQPSITNAHEIVLVDIHLQPPKILHHISEVNRIQNLDVTLNNELIYTVTSPTNKRIPPKMHIYSLIN